MKAINTLEHKIASLFSPYSIVPEIRKAKLAPEDIPIHVYVARIRAPETTELRRPEAAGMGLSDRSALEGCLGEAVERYSWLNVPIEKAIVKRENEIRVDKISIEEVSFLFHKDIKRDELLGKIKELELPWIQSIRLYDKKTVLIPALDLFPQIVPLNQFADLIISTTSGIACGDSFPHACLSAIYEAIERDSITRLWYIKETLDYKYLIEYHGMELKEIFRQCQILDINIEILEIKSAVGLSCYFAYLYKTQKGEERFACGGAFRFSKKAAIIRSVIEASATWNSITNMRISRKPLCPSEVRNGFPNIVNFEDHAFLYSHPWAKKGYHFLISKKSKIKRLKNGEIYEDMSEEEKLYILVKMLWQNRYHVYVADITPNDIRRLGLYVAKAVVPGLWTIPVGKFNAFYMNSAYSIIDNSWPHPFP